MQDSHSFPDSRELEAPVHYRSFRSVSWPAIFAGLTAAIALQFLFLLLGAGLGFTMYSPVTDENPVAELGKGAVLIHGISAVLSLWFGGWVAGRFAPISVRSAAYLHGFLVWTSATVAGALVVSLGTGWMMGGVSKILGGGLSAMGKPVAGLTSGLGDMAKEATTRAGDTVSSFVDEALGRREANAPRGETVRAKREISTALMSLFNPLNESTRAEKRTAAIAALDNYGNMTEAEATTTLDQWMESYEAMKAELAAARAQLEAQAREAADKAAHTLAILSFGTFVAFLLGAIASALGGDHGGKCARRAAARLEVPSSVA